MMSDHLLRWSLVMVLCCVAMQMVGCESSGAQVVYGTGYVPTEPTVVVVRPFAVTAEEAVRDADVLPAWVIRNPRSRFQTSEDIRYGHISAELLAKELINELSLRGIPAVMSDGSKPPSNATIITGQFADLDTGTKWLRPEMGYSLKVGYEARAQIIQHNSMVVEMTVYSGGEGVEGAREMAAHIAHQLYVSYVLGGWGSAKLK